MVNRYTLGGAIFFIMLSAIFGISRAFSWLSQAPERATPTTGQVLTVEGDDLNSTTRQNGQVIDQSDASRVNDDLLSRQGEDDIAAIRAVNNSTDQTFALSPLEEAGTYIQRQKRVEQDAQIAQTEVDVVPTTSDTPVAAQSDTRVTQPEPTRTSSNETNSRSTQQPNTQTEAVPALW